MKNVNRAHVNAEFISQLFKILRIIIPGFTSPEFGFLILVAASLIARSYSDIWMIQTGTIVETAIISMNTDLFKKTLLYFFAGMPIVSKNCVLYTGLKRLIVNVFESNLRFEYLFYRFP